MWALIQQQQHSGTDPGGRFDIVNKNKNLGWCGKMKSDEEKKKRRSFRKDLKKGMMNEKHKTLMRSDSVYSLKRDRKHIMFINNTDKQW